jgi:hypothetical protein
VLKSSLRDLESRKWEEEVEIKKYLKMLIDLGPILKSTVSSLLPSVIRRKVL